MGLYTHTHTHTVILKEYKKEAVDFGKGETCELVEDVEDVNVRFPNGIFYIYMGSLYLIKDGENWWLGEHNNYYQFGKIDSFDSTNAVDFKTLN